MCIYVHIVYLHPSLEWPLTHSPGLPSPHRAFHFLCPITLMWWNSIRSSNWLPVAMVWNQNILLAATAPFVHHATRCLSLCNLLPNFSPHLFHGAQHGRGGDPRWGVTANGKLSRWDHGGFDTQNARIRMFKNYPAITALYFEWSSQQMRYMHVCMYVCTYVRTYVCM